MGAVMPWLRLCAVASAAAALTPIDDFLERARVIDCETVVQEFSHGPDGEVVGDVSAWLIAKQHDFPRNELVLRLPGVPILFDLHPDHSRTVQTACRVVKDAILAGLQDPVPRGLRIDSELLWKGSRSLQSWSMRHELRSLSSESDWQGELLEELQAVFRLHAIRLRGISSPDGWLKRWTLMLEHMLAQLMVVAVDGCIELAHWRTDPDDESSLEGKPGSSCKFPLHETSSGPTVRKILIDQDIHMPQVFFNEIIGFRWDVVSALLGGLAPRLAQVRAPLFLELGVYDGATALRILEAHPEVRYLGADAWDETDYIGCETCTNEFYTNLMDTLIADLEPFGTRAQLINQTTIAAIQSLPDETVDLAFVDANHHTEAVVADMIELTRVMKSGSVIVGHDFSPYWFQTALGVLWVANSFHRSVELSADGTWWFPDMGIETDEILAAWPAPR